jgi:heme-degrading monooxygenase HmoA
MMLIVFRSKLTAAAGEDYRRMNDAMSAHAKTFPGFIEAKSFTAEDGERLALVRWQDAATLEAWATDVKHRQAQRLGRERWYEYYKIEVAEVIRSSDFTRER